MQQALYDPRWGYYGSGPRRLGRHGDFYTAVQAGPLYGQLLAQWAMQLASNLPRPGDMHLIEQGAHDGQLARDILQHCDLPYIIIEPQPAMRAAQQSQLAAFAGRVHWLDHIGQLGGQPALFVANELLDAFAVHRVQWTQGRWQEMGVGADESGTLHWTLMDPCPALSPTLNRWTGPYLEGQCAEVNLAAEAWIEELSRSPFRGWIMLADYGMEEEQLLSPERPQGSLRRYTQHRCDQELLEQLGECDLTSHVNFTQLRRCATAAGLQVEDEQPQGIFLTRLAKPWLSTLEGTPPGAAQAALLRQFQTLTHPAHMGSAFRVLVLRRGV